MMTPRTSKTILITDAGCATGEAIARHLASQGHQLMLGARRLDRVAGLAREITRAGGAANYQELDVTSHGSARAFLLIAEACHGRIDALVNTAGMAHGIVALLPLLEAQGVAHVIHVPADHALHGHAVAEAIDRAIARPGRVDIDRTLSRTLQA